MNNYAIRIGVPKGEVKEILDELTAAQEKIFDCYNRLERLGAITLIEKPSAG